MDSDMLISQTMHNYESAEQLNRPSVALSQPTHDLELILERIQQDGLALHYRSFMQNFAHLFSLFLTPAIKPAASMAGRWLANPRAVSDTRMPT